MSLFRDSDILSLIIKDTETGMSSLCAKYADPLYHFAYSFTKDRALAEDMVQEVFVKIWESRFELNEINSLKSYLHAMLRNKLMNHYRSESVKARASVDAVYQKSTNLNTVEAYIRSREYEEIYDAALLALPAQRRKIFELSRKQELSYEEIAAELNISKTVVKKQILIALKHFRSILSKRAEIISLFTLLLSQSNP